MYSTLPQGRVVGVCQVLAQHRATPEELWKQFRTCGGITKKAFDAYFHGSSEAYAIELVRPRRISVDEGIELADLGASRPPQSFQYIRDSGRGRVLEFAS